MIDDWLSQLIAGLGENQPMARLILLEIKGSSPREAGAEMLITQTTHRGTIGGGALEYQAMQIAASQLASPDMTDFKRVIHHFALGPDLGQCCGGHVTVLIEYYPPSILPDLQALKAQAPYAYGHDVKTQNLPFAIAYTDDNGTDLFYDKAEASLIIPAKRADMPLYIYGAGHVGRALMAVTHDLGLKRIWVDEAPSRFPDDVPSDVMIVPASDMALIAEHAPQGALHIIVTYSHAFDEAITYALLAKGDFGEIGLIGSRTKRARFAKRFAQAGITDEMIDKLHCPVGIAAITGKSPVHVALAIAGQIAIWCQERS